MITKVVNTETKVTVGTLDNAEKDFLTFIDKKVNNNSKFFKIRNYDSLLIKNKYSAKVKCSDEDEFNEEIGKKEVKYKVLDKYYKAFDKKVKDITIDCFRLAFTLLDWVYDHVSIDLGDSIIVELAEKTGYVISDTDELFEECDINEKDEE